MEISVSRLNNRLALQLPAELPLGLVFVVGKVENLVRLSSDDDQDAVAGRPLIKLELVEGTHRLRCVLSARLASEVQIHTGDKIRAGGHLAFDPERADYYLLARDLEMIEEAEIVPVDTDLPLSQVASASILEDLARHTAEPSLTQADLPDWVRQLAPPEVKAKMATGDAQPPPVAGVDGKLELEDESQADPTAPEVVDDLPAEGQQDMFARLSEAMESGEDVELQPEMFAELPGAVSRPREIKITGRPYEIPLPESDVAPRPAPPPGVIPPAARPVPQPQQADPLMILLLITFVVIIITAAVIVLMMWVR